MNKILLIDDDNDILMELHELITDLGFTCFCASNMSEAITAMELHPDLELIISDLRMPDQSGLRLLQILAEKDEKAGRIPVIITSGHADRDDVVNLFRSGAVDFLPKPIHYEHLVTQLRRLFPLHQMS